MLQKYFRPRIQRVIQDQALMGYPTDFEELDAWIGTNNGGREIAETYNSIFSEFSKLELSNGTEGKSLPFFDNNFQINYQTSFSDMQIAELEAHLAQAGPQICQLLEMNNGSAAVYSVNWKEDTEPRHYTNYLSGAWNGVLFLCGKAVLSVLKDQTENVPALIESAIQLILSIKSIPVIITSLASSTCARHVIEWVLNNTRNFETPVMSEVLSAEGLNDETWLARCFIGEFCFERESWDKELTVERLLDEWAVSKFPWAPIIVLYIHSGWRWADSHNSLYMRQRQVVAATAPFPDRLERMHNIEGECARVRILYPSIERGSFDAGIATNDTYSIARARAMLAGLDFVRSARSTEPRDICELYVDPFTGLPIMYTTHDGTVAFYSTGPNKTDNGGVNNIYGKPNDWQGDIVFSVPLNS